MGKTKWKSKCNVPNCPNPEGPQSKFRIPPGEKDRWIKACQMNEKDVDTLTRFCALHFREEDVKRGQERNILRKGPLFILGRDIFPEIQENLTSAHSDDLKWS